MSEPVVPFEHSRSSSPDVDYGRVGLISVAHLENDLYGNMLTSLTPYLVIRGEITTTVAGLVLLVYLFGSSILQPIFGLLSDRTERRVFAALGPLWIGIAASLEGWVSGGVALIALAGLGGIGTAAFHPQAASLVDRLSRRSKAWTMSIFSVGGNIGFALGPLAAAAIAGIGLHWSLVVFLPGAVVTLFMFLFAPAPSETVRAPDFSGVRESLRKWWRALGLIVSVIAIRSAAQYALIIFLPLYYHALGKPAQLGSYYAFVLSVSGAVGGLLGGRLSDAYGRRRVVVVSLLLSVPLLLLALLTTGPVVWMLAIVAGAALLASNAITVVQGQELLPASTGVASGITMGLGFGLSGVISSFLAALSDHVGVVAVVHLVPLLPLSAALLAAMTPTGPASRGAETVAARAGS